MTTLFSQKIFLNSILILIKIGLINWPMINFLSPLHFLNSIYQAAPLVIVLAKMFIIFMERVVLHALNI